MTRTVSNAPRLPQSGNGGAAAKRYTLADVTKGGKGLPMKIVITGIPGIGKTSCAAQAVNPFFLLSPGETGINTLADNGLVPKDIPSLEIQDWENLLSIIGELQTKEHNRQTLILDVVDGFEKLANHYVCVKDYSGDWSAKGFMSYQQGFRNVAAGPWRQLLQELDRLREIKRMAIILLAHTGIANFANPAGADYNRYTPTMYKDAWELTFGWAEAVLFGNRDISVTKEKLDRKAKGVGGQSRIFYTEYSAIADAKNQYNLSPEIDMGNSGKEAWENFIKAKEAGKIGGKDGK